MEKLSYYANSSPEKLDRIGDYFAHKIARDLSRHYNGYVVIAMEAMDILLLGCNSQSLNLFIESYLKIVQLLLESQDPEMQLIATQSFTKFANIEEDTPSYHRRYDFFVSKFSSLCHDNNNDLEVRRMLRIAGLKGLKGVIRKTVSDDLQVDIWDDNHMNKIVPSLLFNMQESNQTVSITVTSPDSITPGSISTAIPGSPVSKAPAPFIEIPSVVAEENLKELVGKATFGNIRSVIRPVLRHLDHHGMWEREESKFAIEVFRIIMNSIQSQHSYAVVQILMAHLDEKSKIKITQQQQHASNIGVKTGIATVLSQIVAITASESIGPIVLDIINNLLNHLRNSINSGQANSRFTEAEKRYQDTVINSLGEFTNNIPDYQKIEIMMFIISRVPTSTASRTDSKFQGILLRSLLKVSITYSTVNMNQALPSAFLKSLLQFSLAADPTTRETVQKIFHQLLDRHNNLSKISKPVTLSPLSGLTVEKAFRQDVMFMKKHGIEIIGNIFENMQLANNAGDNYCALYTTVGLLFVEMSSEEVLTETIRLCLSLQDVALAGSGNMSEPHKAAIHAIVAAILHLSCQVTSIPALASHVEDVIKIRNKRSPWLLPESNRLFNYHLGRRPSLISASEYSDDLFFDKNVIVEVLRSTGHDSNRLLQSLSTTSTVDSSMSRSTSDLNAINIDIESAASSPGTTRVCLDSLLHSFELLKFTHFSEISRRGNDI
jgi:F0F1-type ATP synthase epsilon subunit